MAITYRGTTALITGASSGLGSEFAEQFAARGADVVLVARREDRLRDLADALAKRHGITATVIAMDLIAPDAPAALRRELESRGIRPSTLVNNAGFGMKGAFVDADAARVADMVRLNVETLVTLSRAFLPELIHDGRGALVNIASTAAYQPCPNMAVYGATKAFVLSFTEAIAYETRDSSLTVVAVSPGATSTEFFDVVGDADAGFGKYQTPQAVVARTMRELERANTPASFISGTVNAITSTLSRLVPRRMAVAVSARILR